MIGAVLLIIASALAAGASYRVLERAQPQPELIGLTLAVLAVGLSAVALIVWHLAQIARPRP